MSSFYCKKVARVAAILPHSGHKKLSVTLLEAGQVNFNMHFGFDYFAYDFT